MPHTHTQQHSNTATHPELGTVVPEMAKQLSRPGAQVTRSSSGLGLGVGTAHWTKLTGWLRARVSRRRRYPLEPRLAMWGPGPRPLPLTSAHQLFPPRPGLGQGPSNGAHFWRVSTSPKRPEVQQKAKVSASRTCRLLSSSLSPMSAKKVPVCQLWLARTSTTTNARLAQGGHSH